MEIVPQELSTALASRYRLLGTVGSGGMATVYLANDLKHDRQVAVKVLRPELAASIGGERFAREIAIAARLSHPHILVLIDSGDAHGFLYYVMPYVKGGSLRERLNRDRTLPHDEALRIVTQVASALGHAHERGVVHRDVKPENILLAGDQVILADFGIARAAAQAGETSLTATGMAVGTPAYMSPEQGFGDGALDGRADIYALGCVMYEMLTGRPPFDGATPLALMARHAADTVPALRAALPSLPLYVERAVQKALAKDPASRFATAHAFAETLAAQTVVAPVGRRRLAVLPPTGSSGHEADHLVLGLHEALISHIGAEDVAVIARTSVLPYAETQQPVRQIAQELGVDALIESSLVRDGAALRLQARIVDGASEEVLWSGGHVGMANDVFEVYRDFARSVADQLHSVMSAGRRPQRIERPLVDQATYENYMRGRAHQERFTPPDLDAALQYYQAALRTSPDFAPAHAGMALVWGSKVVMGLVPPLEGGSRWRQAAERAIAADPGLADGHQALGQALAFHEWDWPGADVAFQRAIELNASDPLARTMYSHFLAAMGRPAEALQQGRRALGLDPFNPFHHTMFGMVLMFTGRHADAIAHLTQSLQMHPMNVLARLGLASSHLVLGDVIAGLNHQAEVFAAFGDSTMADVLRTGAAGHDPASAFLRAGELLEARSTAGFVKPMRAVIMFDQGGDLDRAYQWVDRAYQARDHDMAYFAVAPWTRAFRNHPRFATTVERMRLPAGVRGSG